MDARPEDLVRGAVAAAGIAFSVLLKFSGVLAPGWFSDVVTWAPTVAVLILLAWDAWVWKWPPVLRLHHRPRIDGLWKGHLLPFADNGRGNVNPIECYAAIRQSFWSLHVYMCTEESTSMSKSAHLCPNEAAGSSELVYVYDNQPQAGVSDRSPRHSGAARIHCPGLAPQDIEGSYFTDRLSKGDLVLHLVDRSSEPLTFTQCQRRTGQSPSAA